MEKDLREGGCSLFFFSPLFSFPPLPDMSDGEVYPLPMDACLFFFFFFFFPFLSYFSNAFVRKRGETTPPFQLSFSGLSVVSPLPFFPFFFLFLPLASAAPTLLGRDANYFPPFSFSFFSFSVLTCRNFLPGRGFFFFFFSSPIF